MTNDIKLFAAYYKCPVYLEYSFTVLETKMWELCLLRMLGKQCVFLNMILGFFKVLIWKITWRFYFDIRYFLIVSVTTQKNFHSHVR